MKKLALLLSAVLMIGAGGLYLARDWMLPDASEHEVEDPYWGGSQYTVALLKLRGDLLAVTSGEQYSEEKIKRSLSVVLSKSRILTRDSRAQSTLMRSELFSANVNVLKDFESNYLQTYIQEDSYLDAISARLLLNSLEKISLLMDDLLPDMWLIQGHANDDAFQTAQHRANLNVILSVIAASIALLALAMFVFYYLKLKQKNGELLNQKNELVQSIADKNRFMGIVSHELKSPLQTISLSAESLLENLTTRDRVAVIKRLQRGATSLQLQLNDLLTLARSESGKLEYRPDLFEAVGLLDEIVAIESQVAYEKGLRIYVAPNKEPIFALADSGRISQILRNLISNAIKYTDKGGVELSVESVNENSIRFTVKDTGPGMGEGFEKKSMQPFKRYGNIDKREGYGIGLMIAFSLAEYLGGGLEYQTSSKGTTFVLNVPASIKIEEIETDEAESSPKRILLVDDMPDLLQSLNMACASAGYKTDMAESAAVAANLMAANFYNAALIDINMPNRRGDELARDFRRGGAMNNKACLLIGMTADQSSIQQRDMPFDYMLEKPIKIKGLQRILNQLTQSLNLK